MSRPDVEDLSLMAALGFTTEDLLANRQGLLSARQYAMLRQERLPELAIYMAGLSICLFVATVTISNNAGKLLFTVIGIILLACAGIATLARRYRLHDALNADKVRVVTGEVQKNRYVVKGIITYIITIDQHRFSTSASAFQAIEPGQYRGYFVPGLNTLVSAERLEKDDK